MVNVSFLKRLLSVGEKNVLNQLTEFTDLGGEASDLLKIMLSAEDSLDQLNDEIREVERNGDDVAIRVKRDITGGAISSNLMENLVTVTETFDDIIDKAYFISRELRRMNLYHRERNDTAIDLIGSSYEIFSRMLDLIKEALSYVKRMLKASDIDIMRGIREDIEVLEEKGDELKDDLIDEIYRVADSISYLVFTHLTGVVHKIDDMLDGCEDISDLVLTINLSLTK